MIFNYLFTAFGASATSCVFRHLRTLFTGLIVAGALHSSSAYLSVDHRAGISQSIRDNGPPPREEGGAPTRSAAC